MTTDLTGRTAVVTGDAGGIGAGEDEVVEKVMLAESAVKRLVEPDDVADLVAGLRGRSAGMVNGASYTMDGRWTAR